MQLIPPRTNGSLGMKHLLKFLHVPKNSLRIGAHLLVALLSCCLTHASEPNSPIGRKIDEFRLSDFRGKERALADYADHRIVVVAFLGTECPLAKLYGPRLVALADEFAEDGVAIIGSQLEYARFKQRNCGLCSTTTRSDSRCSRTSAIGWPTPMGANTDARSLRVGSGSYRSAIGDASMISMGSATHVTNRQDMIFARRSRNCSLAKPVSQPGDGIRRLSYRTS